MPTNIIFYLFISQVAKIEVIEVWWILCNSQGNKRPIGTSSYEQQQTKTASSHSRVESIYIDVFIIVLQ